MNPPKYKSEGQTERHDIITVCNTPYDVEPTNIVLFGTPQECYQTNDKNTMIWTFHSTEFMVPILSDIHLL
ncbi:TPA: hypothetical protein DCZ39_00080 [Patescibacteria group bacterium]|nr:hypothetical protein [Candidatus Gracilibacteria bacterium]